MLINAHYLDDDALTNYIAAVEGGLRESGSSRSKGSRGFGGSLGISGAKLEAKADSETENTVNVRDHQASRLQRLIAAGHAEPEVVGWIEVSQPDLEFANAGTGAFVEWECDVYIPEAIAVMSNHAGLSSTLELMKALMPSAEALGLDMEGVPDVSEMNAVGSFLDQLDVAPVVVGDDSDTDWKIVGSLTKKWISPTASFDGRVRVIGKVKKRIGEGRWYPMLSLPGMNLVGRDERRRLEREGPHDSTEEQRFIRGPLLVVDFLAIYS
ncbi:DUF6414 family protein [Dermacoccus nishinomiyaensis]